MGGEDRFVFFTEWFDSAASLIRQYNLIYYPEDKTIEMHDIKNKRVFLKRCEYPNFTIKSLYIGSVINVYSRQLKITDYGDVYTRSKFEVSQGKTFAMIKPDSYANIGKILNVMENSGFTISNIKMTKFSLQQAEQFYAEHRGKPFYQELTNFICSDFVVGVELVSDDAIKKWRQVLGPTNCQAARDEAPNSVRALFGTEGVRNAAHGSDSPQSAQREIDFFFGDKSTLQTTALFNNCTCCVIKPNMLVQRNAGKIIDQILSEGFEISALQTFFLDKATSEEFLEVYKGVVSEYTQIAAALTDGLCIAMEIRQENSVQSFRELCGPSDPQIAKTIRQNSIRARYGQSLVNNAVHCTDLPEDGILEVEYFFNILQQK